MVCAQLNMKAHATPLWLFICGIDQSIKEQTRHFRLARDSINCPAIESCLICWLAGGQHGYRQCHAWQLVRRDWQVLHWWRETLTAASWHEECTDAIRCGAHVNSHHSQSAPGYSALRLHCAANDDICGAVASEAAPFIVDKRRRAAQTGRSLMYRDAGADRCTEMVCPW
jgi:hypothetical protein